MVQSTAQTVDEYLESLPPDRRAAVARLRAVAKRSLRGFREGMEYGMPFYRRGPTEGVAFASQRQYIAIYPGIAVISAHRKELAGLSAGKGCVRFPNPDRIDWDLVEHLFRTAAE